MLSMHGMTSTVAAARIFQSPRLQCPASRRARIILSPTDGRGSICSPFAHGGRIVYQKPLIWRRNQNQVSRIHAFSAGLEKDSATHDAVNVITEMGESKQLKMAVHISGSKTQVIFDDVFTKMVDAAQPIPGFRRIKGGKTPDIPKEILLHILGPSKVKKQSITRIINSTIAEYVEEKGLHASKDLRVEESYEELEALFRPGDDFRFNVVVRLMEEDTKDIKTK